MGQIVLTLSKTTVAEMNQAYMAMQKPAPAGAVFAAKTDTSTITAYQSGKVLFQGEQPEVEASKWGSVEEAEIAPKKVKPKHGYEPDPSLFTSSHIGSDEAGTGDYFGPVTVAAAYVTDEQIELLREIGVKDSKNLTDSSIHSLAEKILALKIPYNLIVLHNPKYNELQAKKWTQGKIKTILHNHAINQLVKEIEPAKPTGILIDQFSQPSVYIRHLKSEGKRLTDDTYFITKAESHSIAVATASILARASFVDEMNKLSETVGIELPKGASEKVDRVAGSILRRSGPEELGQYAKMHFVNTKKAETYQ